MGDDPAVQPKFGDLVPWGDPLHYRGGFASPYYNESHIKWRTKVRKFCEEELMPYCGQWDREKAMPKEVYKKAYAAGILPGVVGQWPSEYVDKEGPENWDAFHMLTVVDEIARCGSGGVCWGLFGGLGIGLPPVLHFGSDYLKQKVAPSCLRGDKFICLAITEPYAGSDVANLRATAVLDPTEKFYTVNGEKKWITNGTFADYFTVAVRTGGPGSGMSGISLILIERTMPGVKTTQMDCMGVWASGTAYVEFDDVKVPKENIIGMENMGFMYIMANFNMERMGICLQANRFARVCLEEAFKYAHKRKTFGKKLIDHPVIRAKIADMARQVEANHALIENLIYQFMHMPPEKAMIKMGGETALLKVQCTKTFEFCAREAAQIFGGASYVRGGQGEKVERLYREVRAYAIPGGSEEIMMDLAVRMGQKSYEKILSKM